MRGAQLFEMVEKRGQPFYLIELKLYLISKSRAKALDLREERGARISQRRGPLGPPDNINTGTNIRRPKGPRRCEILAPLSSLKSRALALDFDIR